MSYGMFGVGLLEWLIICIPALMITGVILVVVILLNRNWSITRKNQSQFYQPGASVNPPAPKADRYCPHCGAALQADWTHCPQCGAPIQ